MPIFSFFTFGARPEGSADSPNLDSPAPAASAPGPLSRTASKESLASRSMAREKALRKRQVSRQASHTSAEDRAAESARRRLKKPVVNPRPQAPANPFKRYFNFFVDALAPCFRTPTDAPAPTDVPAPTYLTSASSPAAIRSAYTEAEGILKWSIEVSNATSTETPNASVSADASPPQFTAQQMRSRLRSPAFSARIERLNDAVDEIKMKRARAREHKRRMRGYLFARDRAWFGKRAAIQMQRDRDAPAENERHEQERIDLAEREELLLQGEFMMCHMHTMAAEEEMEHELHYPRTDCGCSLATINRYRKLVVGGMRDSRDGRVSSKQYQVWRGDDSDDLGTPETITDINRYTRDRTSIRRSTYQRYHPYSTSARRVRCTNERHFNNSDASGGAIVAQIIRYENYWKGLRVAAPEERTALKFIDIPWPLRTPPNIPAELTPERVQEFILLKRYGTIKATARERKWAASYELQNVWFPDHVTDWILSRVEPDERKAVRDAVYRVQRALVMLLSNASTLPTR